MRRRRILYVQKPPGGGSATGLYDLVSGLDKSLYEPVILFHEPNYYCERFREIGVEVLVLHNHLSPVQALQPQLGRTRQLINRMNVYRVSKQLVKQTYSLVRNDLPLAGRVARLIQDKTIDLVHQNNDLRLSRATIMAAKQAHVPQICHVRWLHHYSDQKIFFWLDRYTGRSVDYFIYMSRAIEQTCLMLGIPADKGEVLDDPFDLAIYKQAQDFAANIRAEFGVAKHVALISNVGRLMPWKGQNYFLYAMADVVKTYPDTKALIVGAPESEPSRQTYFEELQQLVVELKLSEHVIFTGFRADVAHIMAASDVIVHSSSEPEPFGRVIVEAMATGKPIIATAAGGAVEIFDDQETGLLVRPKDVAQMAMAIRQLLQYPIQAQLMGQRAQEYVQTRFTIEQHVKAVQQIYERVLMQR